MLQPLGDEWVSATKDLIAEVVLEFYGDLDFLPKTKSDLLRHYEKIGYLKDLDEHLTEYSKENGSFLVQVEEGAVVGCGGLRRLKGDSGELVRLWLRREKRGSGLGREIFASLMSAAGELGFAKVFLETSHRCVDAIRLFRKNGFVDCHKYKESIGDVFLCRYLKDGVEATG